MTEMIEMQNLLTDVRIEPEAAPLVRIFENGRYKRIVELPEKNLRDFLTYLIPDWKWMEYRVPSYSCTEKRKAILDATGQDLFQHLIDALKVKEKSLFHYYFYRALHQTIHEITNDEKSYESIKNVIPARQPLEYQQYLDGLTEEFQRCLKLTLVGISYQFDYAFEEKVTDEKFELLEYLFTCQLARFELRFREYVEKEKQTLGTYYRIVLKPVVRFYYNIARHANENRKYQFIKCQELIAHTFPEVERNYFLITKFYEQRHLRIFDDSKKYDDEIKKVLWPVILCRVAMRLKILDFPTGVTEEDMTQARLLFEEEFSSFQSMFDMSEMEDLIGKHVGDVLQSTNVSKIVAEIQTNLKTLMNLKQPDNRIAIFGRNSTRPESLFEIILTIPEMATEHDNFIEIIWDKFDLMKTPEVLQVKNHLGKSIFDYVIASNDPWNLIKFIKKLKFYKYFDHQFKNATGFNLFQHYVKLSMVHSSDNSILSAYVNEIVLYVLEEYDCASLPLEVASDLTGADNVETFGIRNYQNIRDPCPRLCLEGNIAANYVLCLIVAYCRPELLSAEFTIRLSYNNPIVQLLLKIISGTESECVAGFVESLIEVEDYLGRLCFMSEEATYSSKLIASFKGTMLIAAMIHDRRGVIDKIFESENFATTNFKFPSNMKTYDGSYYATMKLIDSNYGDVLSKYNIPKNWINAKEFGKRLLDSRIKLIDSQKRIEINSAFLINSHLKQFHVKTENDMVDHLLLQDDTKTLQFYYENEGLKEFITHPAIAIYVALKWFKYRRIFAWNFWIFVLQLAGYSLFVFGEIGKNYKNCDSSWCTSPVLQNYLQFQTILTIVYMIGREIFQFWTMNSRSFSNHFSTWENTVECLLVVTTASTVLVGSGKVLVYLACFNIFAMMLVMITMFPYSFMYFHMQVFSKVAATFVKFFLTFTTLLFTFVIIFAIIFNLTLPKNEEIQAHSGNEAVETNDFVKNFDNIGNAGLKVVLMLSGEYSIDPFHLNVFQLIVFSLFVFITYILFNLIVGLTIDDVQKLRENANKLVVRQQIEKIVKTDRIVRKFYFEISKNAKQNSRTTRLTSLWNSISYHSMKFFFNKYLHLHRIDKIYVDLKTLNVEMSVADAFTCPVKFSFRRLDIERFLGRKSIQIDNETFEKINQIINDRYDEEYEAKEKNKN